MAVNIKLIREAFKFPFCGSLTPLATSKMLDVNLNNMVWFILGQPVDNSIELINHWGKNQFLGDQLKFFTLIVLQYLQTADLYCM